MRVLGLREGCSLRITDDEIALHGLRHRARLRLTVRRAREYSAGDDLSFLLRG